ncbi:MAG: hypothetical protein FWD36_01775, partial [Treponema sp.]|nr:hypothetical protein [Treponema sp.]
SYTLVFSAAGKADVTRTWTYADFDSQTVTLDAGTWSLTVTACMGLAGQYPAARGTRTGIAITNGSNTVVNIELKAMVENGTGFFSWDLDIEYLYYYSPESLVAVNMTILPLDVETGSPEQTIHFVRNWNMEEYPNNVWNPLELNTGYYLVVFNLSNGSRTVVREEYLHVYQNMVSHFECMFVPENFVYDLVVTNGNDRGPGSLRNAIDTAGWGNSIYINDNVGTIYLESRLVMRDHNLVIEGNGVTITRSPSWAEVIMATNLLYIDDSTVEINRVRFKGGRSANGGAINAQGSDLIVRSCIFSDNRATLGNGGAINANGGHLEVYGCTFYDNSASGNGGAIYLGMGGISIVGNIFYGNNAQNGYPVVYIGDTIYGYGFNVVDVDFGWGYDECGWDAGIGDVSIDELTFSPATFRLLSGAGAEGIITESLGFYPVEDFYGNAMTTPGASAGAVQEIASGSGYVLELVYNAERGGVTISGAANADALYSGSVTLTAAPAANATFARWVVNGTDVTNSPYTFTITAHTRVQAVFSVTHIVSNLNDNANSAHIAGSLRHALTRAEDDDIINITATPGVSVIRLSSALPPINKPLTINGNGVTLTRNASWNTVDITSSLLRVYGNNQVHIKRVHFKDGHAAAGGAILNMIGGQLILESCIFSGNTANTTGGAIVNLAGSTVVVGCTFYGNSANAGGAIGGNGYFALAGNIFYENTANYYPVATGASIDSYGWNVVDAPFGDYYWDCGWYEEDGDVYIDDPVIPVISVTTFRPINGGGADNIVNEIPSMFDYPTVDFYGSSISRFNPAAGAVQTMASGFMLVVDYDAFGGSVQSSAVSNIDGLYTGSITLTATPARANMSFSHWLVNGNQVTNNPYTFTINQHTYIEAVFMVKVGGDVLLVTSFQDGNQSGTLRRALENARQDDIVRFVGVQPGVSTITLQNALPDIRVGITIEGNGITITANNAFRMMYIEGAAVTISGVHFKGGRSDDWGAAIMNDGGALTLESCIFSDNIVDDAGGAIWNEMGDLILRGCTFYANSAAQAGAIGTYNGSITLTGNLFYGNTDTGYGYPIIWNEGGTQITSTGYNVTDVHFGSDSDECGWYAHSTDTTFEALGIDGNPFNTSNFRPAYATRIMPQAVVGSGFPAVDFYGNTRNEWPGAPGAVGTTLSPESNTIYIRFQTHDERIDISQSSSVISVFNNNTLEITVDGDFDYFEWRIDGMYLYGDEDNSFSISAGDIYYFLVYAMGVPESYVYDRYTLTIVCWKGDIPYSKELTFMVVR